MSDEVQVFWAGEHYEVRRARPGGGYEVLARCPHFTEAAERVVPRQEPRALVHLPASASLRRLGRRFIGRG